MGESVMIKNLVWPFYRPIIMAVLVSLGICGCSKVDMPDEVISSYQKAIRINPGLAEAHFNLAIAYNSRTMLDEAISALVKAIEINPKYKDLYNDIL